MKQIQRVADLSRLMCILGLAALPAIASQVDTLVTSDVGAGCTTGILQGTVSASLSFHLCQLSDFVIIGGGASAHADYLSLGTSVTGSLQSQLPGGDVSDSATAQSADVITVGGGNPGDLGFLDFQFELSGTNTAVLTGANGHTGTSVGASFTNLIVCDFNPILLPIGIGCPAPAADAVLNFGAVSYSNFAVDVEVPIQFDVPLGIFFELYSTTGAIIDPSFVVNFDGSSSFLDTAQIISVLVLDSNHQPISDPTLDAQSGTLYPLAGGPSTPAVPEPSGMAFLLAGAMTILAYARRRSKSGT